MNEKNLKKYIVSLTGCLIMDFTEISQNFEIFEYQNDEDFIILKKKIYIYIYGSGEFINF